MKKFLQCAALAAMNLLVMNSTNVAAQGGCIEIKSILVDACGAPEGENEMVRFDVGGAPLNVSNMVVDWPNNAYQGLCQNATTASIVSSVNQNIVGCGMLVEPVGGVLPANSKVLLLTSTNVNVVANSFANLNDTVIVLFQCANNTSGHFANYSLTPGIRTLSIQFTGALGCTDSVSYERSSLVNQFGVTGGFTFENDGAFVEFSASGTATYLNNGCQVLSTGLSLTGGPDVGICPGDPLVANLTGAAANLVGNPVWAGGTGSFSNANALTTTYVPGAGETGIIILTLTGNGPCNAVKTDTVRVNIVPSMPAVTISSSVTGMFTSNVTDSTYFYNWFEDGSATAIPGQFDPDFTPNTNGCYYMVLSTVGGCESVSNTLCITNVGIADIENASISILNNPGSEPAFEIVTAKHPGKVSYNVYDITGRIVTSGTIHPSTGQFKIKPDWSLVAKGLYIVKISSASWNLAGSIILTK